MSKRELSLILYFLRETKVDNECTTKYNELSDNILGLLERLGASEKEMIAIEEQLLELFENTRKTYLKFGVDLKQVDVNYTL